MFLSASKHQKAGGYTTTTDPETGTTECDTFTCGHCQKIVFVKPKEDPASIGGMCFQCMHLVCPRCVGLAVCSPWQKQMEVAEAKDRARRSYGV